MPNNIKKIKIDNTNLENVILKNTNFSNMASKIVNGNFEGAIEDSIEIMTELTSEVKRIYEEEDFESAYNLNGVSNGHQSQTSVIKYLYTDDEGVEKNDLGKCFEEFETTLKNSKFGSIEGFNEFIKENVKQAGYGTVDGVVAAAMALAYEYPKETGRNYFYTKDFSITTRAGIPEKSKGVNGIVLGETNLDCRAFVQWVLYNAGFKAEELNYIDGDSNGEPDIAKIAPVKEDVKTVKPGDIFTTPGNGHIWIVVGLCDGGYYAAENYGHNNGVVINKYSFDNPYGEYPDAKAYDMSGYYDNIDNVRKEVE